MSTNHIATVTNVAPRHIQRANGQGFDLWEVFDSNGQAWVVKPQVAEFAKSLIGQTVTFVTRTEVKMGNNPGQQFTNYYADALYPGAPQAQPGQPAQTGQMAQQQAQPQQESAQEKTLSIYRQVAAKVAASVCRGDQYVFWTMLPELMRYFVAGERPPSIRQAEEFASRTITASGGDPSGFGEGDSLPNPSGDDDIPF